MVDPVAVFPGKTFLGQLPEEGLPGVLECGRRLNQGVIEVNENQLLHPLP